MHTPFDRSFVEIVVRITRTVHLWTLTLSVSFI